MTPPQLAVRTIWLTAYTASLWLVYASVYTVGHWCDLTARFEQLGSRSTAMLALPAAIIAAVAFTRNCASSNRRAAIVMMLMWPLRALERAMLDEVNATCLHAVDFDPAPALTERATTILMLTGPLALAILCVAGLVHRLRHRRTYVQIPSTGEHLQSVKPTADGVVSSAVPEPNPPMFLAPEPPSYLPTARVLAPAIARPDRLTGDRLTLFQVLLGALALFGVLGAIASLTTGYEVYTDASNTLVSTRPAGSGATVFWCLAGAALAALGIARPSRATARTIGWLFIVLIFVGFGAVLKIDGLINFDDLSFSKHTVETGSVAMLQFAIGAMVFAGPVILLTQWRLFRGERNACVAANAR